MLLYRTTLKDAVKFSYYLGGGITFAIKFRKLGDEIRTDDEYHCGAESDRRYRRQKNIQYRIGNGRFKTAESFSDVLKAAREYHDNL